MKALVLDAGGVVFNDPLPDILAKMAADNSLSKVQETYEEIRDSFWSGQISRQEFWQKLLRTSGAPGNASDWEERLLESFDRGPLYFDLFYWSKRCDIFLFSNHRTEWIEPLLSETESFFREIIISDQISLAKPDPQAFGYLLSQTKNYDQVLFVDDKRVNTESAKALGIPSLLAAGDTWREQIIDWLDAAS